MADAITSQKSTFPAESPCISLPTEVFKCDIIVIYVVIN